MARRGHQGAAVPTGYSIPLGSQSRRSARVRGGDGRDPTGVRAGSELKRHTSFKPQQCAKGRSKNKMPEGKGDRHRSGCDSLDFLKLFFSKVIKIRREITATLSSVLPFLCSSRLSSVSPSTSLTPLSSKRIRFLVTTRDLRAAYESRSLGTSW